MEVREVNIQYHSAVTDRRRHINEFKSLKTTIPSKITWITDNVSRGIIPEDHANFCRFEEEMNKKKEKRGIRSCKIFKIMYICSYNATLFSREYPMLLHGA